MEVSGLLGERDQTRMDRMELEQERGITIKAQTVVMEFTARMVRPIGSALSIHQGMLTLRTK